MAGHASISYYGAKSPDVKLLKVGTIRSQAIIGQNYEESGPLELKLLGASHCRCNINKRQGCFGERKNNRLIGKNSLNPLGTEEENQSRKNLIVI